MKKNDTQLQAQDKASFEEFFEKNYIAVEYGMVKKEFEKIAQEYGNEIFTTEYYRKENRNKKSAVLYMNTDAYCAFEEVIESAMDAINQDIVDVVMEISSDMSLDSSVTDVYFEHTQNLLKRFLNRFYDEELCDID